MAIGLLVGCRATYIESCAPGYTFNADFSECVPDTRVDAGAVDVGGDDAFVRPDADLDAPGLDAYEPDSPLPGDAWAPDAWMPGDGGPCSRCPSDMPVCLGGASCVECSDDTHCSGVTPACDTLTNRCVACNVGTDCTAPLAACLEHACVRCDDRADCSVGAPACIANACLECESRADCAAPTPACTSNACVQCEMNTDCGTAGASRCAGSSCAACVGDGDCTHIGGNPRCVAGTCRPCTVLTEATDCGANSCHPTTNTCTTTPRGSRSTCLTCQTDSECMSGLTCAPVNPARGVTGNYCLPIRVGPFCSRPFADVNTAPSASGTSVTYCRHATTTCEAFVHHRGTGDGTCTGAGGSDASCGAPGVTDGLCRAGGVGNRCTYPCLGDDDCPCPAGMCTLVSCTPMNFCSL